MTIDLQQYEPSAAADARVLRWWLRLAEVGDLARAFGPGATALSEFYAQLRDPDATLILGLDDAGAIRLAFQLRVILAGAFVVLWVDPTWRPRREVLRVVWSCYANAFKQFPVLLGVTAQPALLDEHAKWGYTVVGRIPHLYDASDTGDGWLVTCTEADFLASKGSALAARAGASDASDGTAGGAHV